MLQAADALKIKCNFVTETIDYLTKLKYVINPCNDSLIKAYQNYTLSDIISSCLTYEDECELKEDVICLTTVDNICPATVIPCVDQVSLTIDVDRTDCNTYYYLKNPVDNTATFRIGVLNNGIYHPGSAQIVAANTCNNNKSYYNLTTGCIYNVGTTNYDCTPETRSQGILQWSLNAAGATSGYIKTIKLAHVDFSSNITSPVTVEYDIDPTNPVSMLAWNSCPTCVTVNEAELVLNHPNFHVEFKKLLENVSRTLWNGDVNIQVDSFGSGTSWMYFRCWVKHNPTGPWMGFNKNDFSITWAPQGAGGKIHKVSFAPDVDIQLVDVTTNAFYKVDHQTDCTLDTFYVTYSGIGVNLNKPACNFYKYIVNSPNMTITSQTDISQYGSTCTSWTLTGIAIGGNVTNYEWYDYNTNILIGTGQTIIVSEPGIYQVRAYSENGCLNYSTITIA